MVKLAEDHDFGFRRINYGQTSRSFQIRLFFQETTEGPPILSARITLSSTYFHELHSP